MINGHRHVVEISFRFSHLLILFSPKANKVDQLDIDVIERKRENHFVGHSGQRTQQMRMNDHRHFYVTYSVSVRVFKCPPARPRIIYARMLHKHYLPINSDPNGLIDVQRILIPTPCFDRDLRFANIFLFFFFCHEFLSSSAFANCAIPFNAKRYEVENKKVVSSLSIASEWQLLQNRPLKLIKCNRCLRSVASNDSEWRESVAVDLRYLSVFFK